MGLTSVGIGSGMDINGIVTALVQAESSGKIAKFDVNEGKLNAQISGIGSLKSSLSDFQDKLKALGKPETFGSQKVSTSTKDYLTATVDETAVSGKYQVKVEQLAQSQKIGSAVVADKTSPIGEGSLTIGVGSDDTFDIDVSATDSLTDIMDKINNADNNTDVTATIINGELGPQLVLGSKKTGEDNVISVTATDIGGTGLTDTFTMTELTAAKNAIAYIDGVKVVSQSNDIDEAITGVSLSLSDADIDKTTTITVSKDTAKTKSAINGFVESYNTLMTTIQDLTRYDPETEQAGILQGDSLPRSLQSQLRGMLSSGYDTTSDGSLMLTNLGIKTTKEGLLEVDSDKLTEAIENDSGSITEMFTTEGSGLAGKMDTLVDSYLKSGGVIAGRDETLNSQLSRLDDSRTQLDTRMNAYRERLLKQFNAMDLVVANLNSQSSMLTERLNSLPGVVKD